MKKLRLFALFAVLFIHAYSQQNETPIFKALQNVNASRVAVNSYYPFVLKQNVSNRYGKYSILTVNKTVVSSIIQSKPDHIQISIPGDNGNHILSLRRVSIFSADASVVIQEISGPRNLKLENYVTYHGIVEGVHLKSMVSFTVFDGGVRSIISIDNKEYSLGPLNDINRSEDYLFYEKSAVNIPVQTFNCETVDLELPSYNNDRSFAQRRGTASQCINIHFEISYRLNTEIWGGTAESLGKFVSIFNQVALLYFNEGVTIQTSYLKIWNTPDPYQYENSVVTLSSFSDKMGELKGTFGHLLHHVGNGGYATMSSSFVCGLKAVSGLHNTFEIFPKYNWNANVITHEIGHNLGSNHTQWCGWVGGPIDNCVDVEDGPCSPGPTPLNGGTIMSYCHNNPSIGINFNNGFGKQPGDLIRQRISSATCLSTCEIGDNCGDNPITGLSVEREGLRWKLKWNPVNVVIKIAQRDTTNTQFIEKLTIPPGVDSAYIAYPNNCNDHYEEIRLTKVCQSGESIPLVITLNASGSTDFKFEKKGMNITFQNLASCFNEVNWDFGDGTFSKEINPTKKYNSPGIYEICLTTKNAAGSQKKCIKIPVFESWVDELNNNTSGLPNAITYKTNQCEVAAEFTRKSSVDPMANSFITYEYDKWIPNQGTIEFLINVKNGYSNLSSAAEEAAIFGIVGSEGNSIILLTNSEGDFIFRRTLGGITRNTKLIGAGLKFNEWHVLSISYGTVFRFAVDGYEVYNLSSSLGNSLIEGITTVGQVIVDKDKFFGFEGLVDKVRFSNTESDFKLSRGSNPVVTISKTPDGLFCTGSTISFTSTSNIEGGSYQWRNNGVPISGATNSTFSSNTLTSSSMVDLTIQPPANSCFGTEKGVSNAINLSTSFLPSLGNLTASVSVSPAGIQCEGATRIFTLVTNGDKKYHTVQWLLNGVIIPNETGYSYSSAILKTNDKISAIVKTTAPNCFTNMTVTSNVIEIENSISSVPTVKISSNLTTSCLGNNISFTAHPENGGSAPKYQWKVNGINVGTNSSSFNVNTLKNGDAVMVEMTSNANCLKDPKAISNSIVIQINNSIVPTATIVQSPAGSQCADTPLTFTANTNIAGGSYQWKINDVNVSSNSNSFISSSLKNNDVVSVLVSAPTGQCYSPATVTSNSIVIRTAEALTPAISIVSSASAAVCSGTNITFTATALNAGTTPSFQWRVNGTNAGTNSRTFTSNSLKHGDILTSTLTTNNAGCFTTTTATSNAITVIIKNLETPAVSINSNSGGEVCLGTNVTFTATVTNSGTSPKYQWKINGNNAGTNSNTFITNSLKDGDLVNVELTSNAQCISVPVVFSNSVATKIKASVIPLATITGTVESCAGKNMTFEALTNISDASYQWKVNGGNAGSNNKTFSSTNLKNNDEIRVVITSPNNECYTAPSVTSNALTVKISTPVTPAIQIASSTSGAVCTGTPITFTATSSNAGSLPSYQWKVNGNNVGTNNPTFVISTLKQGDIVSANLLVSGTGCYSSMIATSNLITAQIKVPGTLAVAIQSSNGTSVCEGTPITFTTNVSNASSTVYYQWYVNNRLEGTNASIILSNWSDGTKVYCKITTKDQCGQDGVAESNLLTIRKGNCQPNVITVIPIDPSCNSSAGGLIEIATTISDNYSYVVTGQNFKSSGSFTGKSLKIPSLNPGSYKVCVTPFGKSEQCFNVNISQPTELLVETKIVANNVEIKLGGGGVYEIKLNGKTTSTSQSMIILPIEPGINILSVQTGLACQGIYRNILRNELPGITLLYPNPSNDFVYVFMPGFEVKAQISLLSSSGQTISNSEYFIPINRIIRINLKNLASGQYFIKVNRGDHAQIFKVQKL